MAKASSTRSTASIVTLMADPEEQTTPTFVRDLTSATEPASEPLDLDPRTIRELAERVHEIEASRAAAAVSGRDYVIR